MTFVIQNHEMFSFASNDIYVLPNLKIGRKRFAIQIGPDIVLKN